MTGGGYLRGITARMMQESHPAIRIQESGGNNLGGVEARGELWLGTKGGRFQDLHTQKQAFETRGGGGGHICFLKKAARQHQVGMSSAWHPPHQPPPLHTGL